MQRRKSWPISATRLNSYISTSSSSADVARTQAERAINDGVNCLVGAFDSGITLAIAQVCEQRQVPLIVNIAAAPQITEQGYKYLVRNFQSGGQLVTNGLRLIRTISEATKLDFKTAVFLHANDTFGTCTARRDGRHLSQAELPFQLIESIAYDPKAQDLSVEVAKMRSLNPDLVTGRRPAAATPSSWSATWCASGSSQRRSFRRARPASIDEEFYQALGPLADYLMFNLPWANPKSR